MSAYANDPRVADPTKRGELFHVTCDGGSTAQVRRFLDTDVFVVWGDDEDRSADWREFATADEAIRSLIGEPQ